MTRSSTAIQIGIRIRGRDGGARAILTESSNSGTAMNDPAKSHVPPNVAEFNAVAGYVFARLYAAFPSPVPRIDRDVIAAAMGVTSSNWGDHVMPSGKSFSDLLGSTIGWLDNQNYMKSVGGTPIENVILTDKGLAALNAIPQGLSGTTIGSSLVTANETGRSWTGVGELVGGMIGGFTKSISGG
jgi:hypothetical protein